MNVTIYMEEIAEKGQQSEAGIRLLRNALRDHLHGRKQIVEEQIDSYIEKRGKGAHGKPYVSCPHFHYNISHSGTHVILAAAEEAELGVDIQVVETGEKKLEMQWKLANTYFSEEEKFYIKKANNDRLRAGRFCQIWVLRESFIKATGKGLSQDFREFSIKDIGKRTVGVLDHSAEPIQEERCRFWQSGNIGGYRMAICGMSGGPVVVQQMVQIRKGCGSQKKKEGIRV